MDPRDQEIAELRRQMEDLQRRMERLERSAPQAVTQPIAPVAATSTEQTEAPSSRPAIPPISGPVPHRVAEHPRSQPIGPHPRDAQSLETRIGTHWLNRIGIVAVLVGVSYFLKYAFDNNWIGPSGRIAIGLIAGIAITFWSETFRRKGYKLFSYGLKAIGIGTLYLSLWAAVQVYHLISPGVGFVAMLIVTAATVMMALTENSQLLAGYALAGGFSTPALCSTGQNHEIFLFSYTAILAGGAVVLTALRGWRRVTVGAFLGTLLMYVAWYATYYDKTQLTPTFFFATLFFLIFAAAALVPRRGEPVDSTTLVAIVSIANALAYFLQVYAMVESLGHNSTWVENVMAWFAVGLAAFFVIVAQQIGKQGEGSENRRAINLIHLALGVGFLTTAIPLKLSGHWITIGWLVEAAALLYVGERIKHLALRIFAGVALILGIVKLLTDSWPRQTVLLLNARFGTYLVALAVLGLIMYGLRNRDEEARMIGYVCGVAFNVLALIALYIEVQDYFFVSGFVMDRDHFEAARQWVRDRETIEGFTHSAVWMVYGACLMALGFRRGSAFLRWQAIVLLAITVFKVFLVDTSRLDLGFRILSFIGLGVILLGISFLYQRKILKLPGGGADANPATRTQS